MRITTCRSARSARRGTRSSRSPAYVLLLTQLSENFIFIYLGLSLFTGEHLVFQPMLILFTLFAVVASRYCAVFPIAWALNQLGEWRAQRRLRHQPGVPVVPYHLPRNYQLMLFWAGLRGAVGFALSAGIEGENTYALQTSVLVAVVMSVIVFGGTTAQMLEILQIDTGVEDDEAEHALDDDAAMETGLLAGRGRPSPPVLYHDEGSPRDNAMERTAFDANEVVPDFPGAGGEMQAVVAGPGGLRSVTSDELDETNDSFQLPDGTRLARDMLDQANMIFRDGQWFQRIDERYLLPMFSNSVANRKHEMRREQAQARRHSSQPPVPLAVPYERDTSSNSLDDGEPALASGRVSPMKNKQH